MQSRRDFLKKTSLLAAGSGVMGTLAASVQKAFAIDPPAGSTYLDAEHVVILMQENRSFDHAYGSLRGVRGFNDPRAMTLTNGNPVWLQTNGKGETYSPFRLNLLNTKSTWMGSLPHTRDSQVAARNEGKHDRWLDAKRSDRKEYEHLPLTLGYYNREDLPFYYALADAFTICDQNFCSALSCTTPNRLYLWTGKLRAQADMKCPARLTNEQTDFDHEAGWITFPERLEAAGISWRVYQNEIALFTGLEGEEDAWLSNFGDNPLEYFTQYGIRFSKTRQNYLRKKETEITKKLSQLQNQTVRTESEEKELAGTRKELVQIREELSAFSKIAFDRLPPSQQNLHHKAFTINASDRHYRTLESLKYDDNGIQRQMQVPKGDVLHQFRKDVQDGKLPTVSWIVPPERFSDHPSSPWYGAWCLSEVFDILTHNPEVWKKTIFILCYDENDGYFDHIPPFMPPHPDRPETGKVSAGIDAAIEQISPEQEKVFQKDHPNTPADPIGLGYRVPLLIASPWTRGGYVCSQVFDHTSILQWLEKFLSHKTGHSIREDNIGSWRRAVCGDLTSVFRPYHGEKVELPQPVKREPFLESISQAQFRPAPADFSKLTNEQIAQTRSRTGPFPWLPRQEAGMRPACALPYELVVDGRLSADGKSFAIRFASDNKLFGARSAGAPFRVYAPAQTRRSNGTWETGRSWNYAVTAGDNITDAWQLADFKDGHYQLQVSGPNGFYREFCGSSEDPRLEIIWRSEGKLRFVNHDDKTLAIIIEDMAYGSKERTIQLKPDEIVEIPLDLASSFGWYDLRIRVPAMPHYEQRYAGHIENGRDSFSDPAMATR